MKKRIVRLIMLTAVGLVLAGSAERGLAGPVNSDEVLQQLYALDCGARGSGTTDFTETGMQYHGAFGAMTAAGPKRYFQGESGESQDDGQHEIAYKGGGGGTEYISEIIPSAGPKLSSTYYGGDSFDGTALWLTGSLFDAGGAPSVGSDSPPTDGTSPVATAQTGANVRREDANITQIPVTTGATTTNRYLMSADVYVPTNAPTGKTLRLGLYGSRVVYGILGAGGNFLVQKSFTIGAWSKVEMRVTVTIDGGVLAESSDDSATVSFDLYINGTLSGSYSTVAGADMQTRTGSVNLSPSFAIARGWQGDLPSVFLDNITVSEILPGPDGTVYWQE